VRRRTTLIMVLPPSLVETEQAIQPRLDRRRG
jgi:hypothetical protein